MFLENLQNNFNPTELKKDTIRNRDTITARRMTRKTFRQKPIEPKKSIYQKLGAQKATVDDPLDPFTDRFGDMINSEALKQEPKESMLRRPTKNMKSTNYVKNGGLKSFRAPGGGVMMKSQLLDQDDNHAEEYDNEYDNEEEEDSENGEDFYSQQDYEVYAFVMDPLKVELEQFLKVDDEFNYKYTNP